MASPAQCCGSVVEAHIAVVVSVLFPSDTRGWHQRPVRQHAVPAIHVIHDIALQYYRDNRVIDLDNGKLLNLTNKRGTC